MPWTFGSALSRATSAMSSGWVVVAGRWCSVGEDADLLAVLPLSADVDGRCRVVADAHHGEAGLDSLRRELLHRQGHLAPDLRRDLLPVDDHGARSLHQGSRAGGPFRGRLYGGARMHTGRAKPRSSRPPRGPPWPCTAFSSRPSCSPSRSSPPRLAGMRGHPPLPPPRRPVRRSGSPRPRPTAHPPGPRAPSRRTPPRCADAGGAGPSGGLSSGGAARGLSPDLLRPAKRGWGGGAGGGDPWPGCARPAARRRSTTRAGA